MKSIPVVFENKEILVVNKPAGVPVQGGEGISRSLDKDLSAIVGYKIHLVHRLDKETCGLMIVAKNPAAAAKWIRLVSSKKVRKEYEAVCFGRPSIDGKETLSGVITSAVRKSERELSAETSFSVSESFSVPVSLADSSLNQLSFSVIHLVLGTGRMHQIRIHLASVGAPVCGDDKHGDFKLNKIARKALKIKNLLLCSKKITMDFDGTKKSLEIDLPDYFSSFATK
ncbi:MAG: RNA pseudouridine synthase [Treponema sp.]|nr:RNA pseudouridine synthase [Treponema sp.]